MDIDKDSLWLLGYEYDAKKKGERARFHRDVTQLAWFTYRRGFECIGETNIQTDAGWGCMLRCGQMLLANAMMHLHRGPDFFQSVKGTELKKAILAMFADNPKARYSIHNIAMRGTIVNKNVGDWFGPNAMAQVIRSLMAEDESAEFAVHVAMDACVCIDEIDELCTTENGSNIHDSTWKPLLLLIPLRLGLHGFNADYTESIQTLYTFPEMIGAIGGMPNSAFYFIGFEKNKVAYLDPHFPIQLSVTEQDPMYFPSETYSCNHVVFMKFSSIDPSLSLGFVCRTRANFHMLLARFNQAETDWPHPLFSVVQHKPAQIVLSESFFNDEADPDSSIISNSSEKDRPCNSTPTSLSGFTSKEGGKNSNNDDMGDDGDLTDDDDCGFEIIEMPTEML